MLKKIAMTGAVILAAVALVAGSPATPDREVAAFAVRAFRWQLLNHPNVIGYTVAEIRAELAGKNLMCWCPIEEANGNPVPCHADVLLRIADGKDI